MSVFRLSAFADEVGPDLKHQVAALAGQGVGGLDLRSVGGVNVLDLSAETLAEVRGACDDAGLRVQCVGSPVNKVPMAKAGGELDRLHRAIEAAKAVGTDRVRIFTPEGGDWPGVEALLERMCAAAEGAGVILLHENDAELFGAYPDNARRLFERFASPHFRAAFDFANAVLLGFRPLDDWFPWVIPYLDTLHVKDAIRFKRRIVPAGEGEARIVETLRLLVAEGWSGTLTLEPHLQAAGRFGGFTGAELFSVAVEALRRCVKEAGGEWE